MDIRKFYNKLFVKKFFYTYVIFSNEKKFNLGGTGGKYWFRYKNNDKKKIKKYINKVFILKKLKKFHQ